MRDWDFWDWLLSGVLVLGAAGVIAVIALYSVPREPLSLPELQSAIRVGRLEDFQSNTGRLERWGNELILVIRGPRGEVPAVSAVSPLDGCVLGWDEGRQGVVSPCSYVMYSQWGTVVAGLSQEGLETYPVEIREGVIQIGRTR